MVSTPLSTLNTWEKRPQIPLLRYHSRVKNSYTISDFVVFFMFRVERRLHVWILQEIVPFVLPW